MKLLIVTTLNRFARAVSPIAHYVRIGRSLGHEVAVFGEQNTEFPSIPFSLDVKRFDYAVFVVYETKDFPDLPYLAQLLDGMPKERRVIIDCTGRYNDTVRVEHDFNHLERLDNHQGWEWVEGFQAVSDTILQPTLTPLRSDVRPFLFHAFDPHSIARPYASATEAVEAWQISTNGAKPYGVVYVGNNWQRWTQVARFLEAIEPIKDQVGPICLAGWAWDHRPDWAAELQISGIDVDRDLAQRLGVETKWSVPFDEVVPFLGQGRFCPVIQRPLFNHLSLVTNRTFETFCADTVPILMLPEGLVEAVHGPTALPLTPGDDITGRVVDMTLHPEAYWDAVLKTRAHLAMHHSYERRFQELLAILDR